MTENFFIKGQWSSFSPWYYAAQVKRCSDIAPKSECASEKEIDSKVKQVGLDFFYKSYYFDPNEFKENPIKSYVKFFHKPLLENTA